MSSLVNIDNQKSILPTINEATIAAGGTRTYNATLLDMHMAAITVRITYGAVVTAGIRVWILASRDNTFAFLDSQNALDAFAFFDPTFPGVGLTVQTTKNLDLLPAYFQILVQNLDGANAQGAIRVDIHRRGL